MRGVVDKEEGPIVESSEDDALHRGGRFQSKGLARQGKRVVHHCKQAARKYPGKKEGGTVSPSEKEIRPNEI